MFNLHMRSITLQAFSKARLVLSGLNLQGRFLLIMGVSTACAGVLLFVISSHFTDRLLTRIGARFAIEQSLFDKARNLKPMMNAMALANAAARDPQILDWIANESNPVLRRKSTNMLHERFHGTNYYLAIRESKNIYYFDPEAPAKKKSVRYRLNASTPGDKWIFDFIDSGESRTIKVFYNRSVGSVKMWIMVAVRQGGKTVGVVGTGVSLYDFARNASTVHLPSVTNMFIDHGGDIQIYNDVTHFDFPAVPSLTEPEHQHLQILRANDGDEWLHQAIRRLNIANIGGVETELVNIKGKHYLAGLTAIPELDWYDLTLIDLSNLLPQSEFLEMVATIIFGALLLLGILALSLHRLVLKPVSALTSAVARIRKGDFSSKPWTESGGEVKELIAQFHDMASAIYGTQQWLEDEISKRTHQLHDAQKVLEISLVHERDGRETQANLMALMAHEMRSPIAVISNTAQMMAMLVKTDHPKLLPRTEKIMASVRQLSSLMDNFLSEKWLDMDKQGLNRVTGDLNQFCAAATRDFTASHGRAVRFEPWQGDTSFCADWQLLQIAISNLLDNADKYSSPDRDILLKVFAGKAGMLCIEVSDHGVGIPADLQPHVFEKFARGRHSADIQGSGLGLYLVNWIARFHGGYTDVSSTEGVGSSFHMCLPVC